ncbi:MAG: type II toxin-antitoxin system VapC family toxin, partial [Jatrophihabitans sp.]
MRLVDANVLLYAVNADAEHHRASQRWLDSALAGADTV